MCASIRSVLLSLLLLWVAGDPTWAQTATDSLPDSARIRQRLYGEGYSQGINQPGRYSGVSLVTAVSTLAGTPVLGLIPAIAFSSSPRKESRLKVPQGPNSLDSSYRAGFRNGDHKLKRQKAWRSYATVTGIQLTILWIGVGVFLVTGVGR